jgi:hypothetical protein
MDSECEVHVLSLSDDEVIHKTPATVKKKPRTTSNNATVFNPPQDTSKFSSDDEPLEKVEISKPSAASKATTARSSTGTLCILHAHHN